MGGDSGFMAGQLVGVVIAAVIGYLVAKDANSRGMNGLVWGICTFLFCIVALPLYLIMRKPKIDGGTGV